MTKKTNDERKNFNPDTLKRSTGIPAKISNDGMAEGERITADYTTNDDEIAPGVRRMHVNRNEDKRSSRSGGYKGL